MEMVKTIGIQLNISFPRLKPWAEEIAGVSMIIYENSTGWIKWMNHALSIPVLPQPTVSTVGWP